jgi:hypothetical protein
VYEMQVSTDMVVAPQLRLLDADDARVYTDTPLGALTITGTRSESWTQSTPGQARYFNAVGNFWTTPLPDDAPIMSNSAAYVSAFRAHLSSDKGGTGNPANWWTAYSWWVDSSSFSFPVYEVDASTPLVPVRFYRNRSTGTDPWNGASNHIHPDGTNSWAQFETDLAVRLQTVGVRIPAAARSANMRADYSWSAALLDAHMVIVETDTHRYTEMWTVENGNSPTHWNYATSPYTEVAGSPVPGWNGWICHAASDIPDYRLSTGTAENRAANSVPGWGWTTWAEWRANASGPHIQGGMIYDDELDSGTIPHALCLSIATYATADWWDIVWPAKVRGDGQNQDLVKESMIFRLPPGYDVSAISTGRGARADFAVRTVCKAIRDHGLVVHDVGGSYSLKHDPFGAANYGGFYDGILAAIPSQDFQVVDTAIYRPPGFVQP